MFKDVIFRTYLGKERPNQEGSFFIDDKVLDMFLSEKIKYHTFGVYAQICAFDHIGITLSELKKRPLKYPKSLERHLKELLDKKLIVCYPFASSKTSCPSAS